MTDTAELLRLLTADLAPSFYLMLRRFLASNRVDLFALLSPRKGGPMQHIITRRAFVISLGMLAVPLTVVAQEKSKDKQKSKEEKKKEAEGKKDEAKDKAEDAVDDKDKVVDGPGTDNLRTAGRIDAATPRNRQSYIQPLRRRTKLPATPQSAVHGGGGT